ncbi:MAG: ABC transporter ATP-binding protein [Lautropia sp.]
MSTIALQGVGRHWGPLRAVDDLSFSVEAGTFTVLLGPSGCGKSTTLRLIAGLERVTSGRIHVAGADVTDAPPSARQISMVFQSYALFPHLSVAENIVFGLRVRRHGRADIASRLDETARLLGLEALLERKPSQLSGGQQQRVALGRAIISRAPVCLMDEPLSNLDARLRQDMRREIRALQRSLGITMVYVTHDQVEAMTMADRVVLLAGGRLEQHASPAELYARPETRFAASFVGTPPMNLFALEPCEGGLRIAGTDGPVVAQGRDPGVDAGVRPESLRLADDAPLAATVEGTEYLGADTIVACRAGAARLLVRAPGRSDAAPGARVRLGWPPGSLHFFDHASGRRRDDLRQDEPATPWQGGPPRPPNDPPS